MLFMRHRPDVRLGDRVRRGAPQAAATPILLSNTLAGSSFGSCGKSSPICTNRASWTRRKAKFSDAGVAAKGRLKSEISNNSGRLAGCVRQARDLYRNAVRRAGLRGCRDIIFSRELPALPRGFWTTPSDFLEGRGGHPTRHDFAMLLT